MNPKHRSNFGEIALVGEFGYKCHVMQIPAPLLEKVLRPLRPAAIYLFGSVAAGRERPDSDVDVGFVPLQPVNPETVFDVAQELAAHFGREVDLVDLSRASAVMCAQVVGTGRRLSVLDPRRTAEFEMYALSDYARANEERRAVLAAFTEPAHAR